MSTPPPGFYPAERVRDPLTGEQEPLEVVRPERNIAELKNLRIAAGAGTVALLAGAVGPWVTAFGALSFGPTANAEVSVVVFGGIVMLALAVYLAKALRLTTMAVGGLALAEAVYVLVRISQAKADADEFGALISPGWGLFLTMIASVFLIVSTFVVKGRPEAVVASEARA
jgi:hypothetical protein